MNHNLELIYLELLSEAKYDDDKWQRFDVYHGIEIYYNVEHVLNRLKLRYSNLRFIAIRQAVKKFLKEISKDNILNSANMNIIPFTCHCILSDIWFSGVLKYNFGQWRCNISTLLPNNNPTFNKQDLRKDINI